MCRFLSPVRHPNECSTGSRRPSVEADGDPRNPVLKKNSSERDNSWGTRRTWRTPSKFPFRPSHWSVRSTWTGRPVTWDMDDPPAGFWRVCSSLSLRSCFSGIHRQCSDGFLSPSFNLLEAFF
ncbi:hypothetical protein CEXT_54691 [Caerostris extrusa]|uniref:Uncharacterized protein n=1 Tax=Caerostris extrusa TaxID=172846 RepID=A0AAV4UGQ2_CAEEX|nr:hypothetical protein CEXT_54691 [Caerostris extrusa]